MKFDMNLGEELMKEMVDLWVECKTRADRIGSLMERLNKSAQNVK